MRNVSVVFIILLFSKNCTSFAAYKAKLESYIECDTGGYFQTLLVALLKCDRDESKKVDKFKAIADAKALYKAGKLFRIL